MKSFVALSVILLATSASSSITIPLTKLRGSGAYLKGSPDAGRARAAFLKHRTDDGPTPVPVTSLGYYSAYTTKVGIGNPPTYYNLIVNTGSSFTSCGAGIPYVETSTTIPTKEVVNIFHHGDLRDPFDALEYLDQVTLAPNLVIVSQSIFNVSLPLEPANGILGLAPHGVTVDNVTMPTVMNNLVSQGFIKNQILGVYFTPPTNDSDATGALTYGGTDSSLYEGELTWVPVTKSGLAFGYWGFDVTLCTYGNNAVIQTSTPGIVDTSNPLVLLANDFFSVYMNAIPGANMNDLTGLLEIPPSSITYMQPLNFTMAGRVFSMDVAAQLFPAEQSLALGGVPEKRYGTVSHLGRSSGKGPNFVFGMPFLERYYSAFDADGKRVGFAQTNNTFST